MQLMIFTKNDITASDTILLYFNYMDHHKQTNETLLCFILLFFNTVHNIS